MQPKVSVCLACHNQYHLIGQAITSCQMQDYSPLEIIVLDDASTDKTSHMVSHGNVQVFRSKEPSGTGGAFNKAISYSTGDIVVLLCSDDVFTDHRVISDIVNCFNTVKEIGHVSRFYHQFVDGDRRPVRAWRGNDVIELANNPSGMAFRREAIQDKSLTNRMFVEVSQLVSDVISAGWLYSILKYDTVAVRIHKSISRTPGYYKKMWNSSPVLEWSKLGWNSNDFTHLIQVGVNFTKGAVLNEAVNYVRVSVFTLFNPCFWFFSILSLLTPRVMLFRIPEIYRATWGRWTTREVKRP